MLAIDPLRLARRQLELDRERTSRFPHLLAHKVARMTASPLALLRGSAPVYYRVLGRHPALVDGPPGEGWLVGDCHLENFGAFRTGPVPTRARGAGSEDPITFDLNDFDDAFVGPWRLDVVRLLTSVVLGGRELGTGGRQTLDLADAVLDGYIGSAFSRRGAGAEPRAVKALVAKVHARSRTALLDARTEVVHNARRFARGDRYEPLPDKLRARVDRAFARYVKGLPAAVQPPPAAVEVVDAAFRVAGTGSLGCLRVAVLARGKGGPDGAWVFDMKEEDEPSAACLVRPPALEPAERVAAAVSACLTRPPRLIGTTRLRKSSMFVRRLAPQEDRLDLTRLSAEDLGPVARYLGALLGAAHRRGARRLPRRRWGDEDRATLLAHTLALAGMYEAMYLAYCQLVRR